MTLHRNARTTPMSRAQFVARVLHTGWTYQQAAEGSGVSRRTVAKWVQRFREAGPQGLEDRSSRPAYTPHITPPHVVAQIRRVREHQQLPAWAIGRALQVPRSTVGAWLRRLGLSRPPAVPPVPVQRYEWPRPGDLLHLDIKPLGRFRQPGHRIHADRRIASPGAGWEYVHADSPVHTPDQRESGTLHSNAHSGLGLRPRVRDVTSTPPRAASVAAVLQSRAAACQLELLIALVTPSERRLMNNVFDTNN